MTASFVFLAVGRQAPLEQYSGPMTPKLEGNLDFILFRVDFDPSGWANCPVEITRGESAKRG